MESMTGIFQLSTIFEEMLLSLYYYSLRDNAVSKLSNDVRISIASFATTFLDNTLSHVRLIYMVRSFPSLISMVESFDGYMH